VLTCAWVEIEGSWIGNIPSRVIRHDRNIIAYLVLLRPTFERVKGIAHRHVRRPGKTAIHAVRIEQLRVDVIRSIPCIQPYRINPSIRSDADRTEIVPLVMVNRIVIDPMRRAEGQPAVRAAREHHVSPGTETSWLYTGDHVNIIVSGTAGAVYCQERLPYQATWIGPPRVAEIETAAQADLSDLVKSGRDCRVLRIAGAKAPKWARKVGRAADEKIAVCIHIERSPDWRARKKDWTHPCSPVIGGAAELPAAKIVARGAPSLILQPMTGTVGPVYGEPLLVASAHVTKC